MRTRNRQLCIRLTDNEYARIRNKSEVAKLSIQAYVIQSCLGKEIKVVHGAADIVKIRAEIKRIGNNINQIAKNANTYYVSQHDIDIILERQSLLLRLVTKFYDSFNPKRK